MSDKIVKSGQGWGEDPFLAVREHRTSEVEVPKELTDRVLALYLMRIRQAVNEDGERGSHLRETMKYAVPAASAADAVRELLADQREAGTEDLFDEAVDVILRELEEQRKVGAARWIVDSRTGRAMVPLTEDSVYRPPDYVGLDGKLHKAIPKIHPAVALAVADAAVEEERAGKLRALSKDPLRAPAYRHLTEPQSIAESARERLRHAGMRVVEHGDPDPVLDSAEEAEVEFGRENVEADMQSTNESFHRVANYAAVLATKVSKLCGPGGTCSVGDVSMRTGPKQRWFIAPVRTARSAQA